MTRRLRLGVNIDHVATIRNARGGRVPEPARAAEMAVRAGADGITPRICARTGAISWTRIWSAFSRSSGRCH